MANLSVRKLDPKTYEELRLRAAKHGVSMEEEVRQIISQAVGAPDDISVIFTQNFGQDNGIDLDDHLQKLPHEPIDFDS